MKLKIYRFFIYLGFGCAFLTPAIAQQVTAGGHHTIAVNANGTVVGWGLDNHGQLGDGVRTSAGRTSPVSASGLGNVIAVAAGGEGHTIALKADGTVMAWGNNGFGRLGDGSTVERLSPVTVTGLTGVVAVAVGAYHSVALKADGTVWTWGWNYHGQLGNDTTSTSVPVAVLGLSGVVAISAGEKHTVALNSDGTVVAWGNNDWGQLGDGSTATRNYPTLLSGLTGVAAISAGNRHTLALKRDGTVLAWGSNSDGQLGDGTATAHYFPASVMGLGGVSAIAAGGGGIASAHSLALKSDGTVVGWGSDGLGQLGDGSAGYTRLNPVKVVGITGAIGLAAGGGHSVAVKDDGTVWAWGYNASGQLGDGTTSMRTIPVVVPGLSLGITTPSISFNQPSLILSDQEIGTGSAPQRLTLNNSGSVLRYITGIVVSEGFTHTTSCGASLAPGASCTVSVTFTPTSTGYKAGTLSIGAIGAVAKPVELSGTGLAVVPSQPIGVAATGGTAQATVSFTAPADTGGSAISGYTVTSIPAGGIDSNAGTTALSHIITGLTNGTAYTFTVVATNGAGNSAASATSNSVTPVQISQVIRFGSAPSLTVGGWGSVSATGGASGNPVTFTSTAPAVCTFVGANGSTVTALTAGNCVVAANQAGNANYGAAPELTLTFVVDKFQQYVGFGAAPNLTIGSSAQLNVLGSAPAAEIPPQQKAIVATSSTPLICTVAEYVVTALTAGDCVVVANQAGDTNYIAAPQATQTITIAAGTQTLSLAQGWNLVGNSTDTPINVTTTFADSSQFVTVWKWEATQSAWSFYAPGLAAQSSTALADYAASKGYQVLNSVAGGEGFWVNVKQPASVNVTQGQNTTVANVGATLLKGWNLVAVGETATPKQFCNAQSTGVTTLWAWDAPGSAWYFYAPALDVNAGLADYVTSKGYLDFTVSGKTLGSGIGFWVNKP